MNILGIGFLSEASACVISDGRLLAAVSEERLNRRKLWYGFPEAAILEVLSLSGLSLADIDLVATHGFLPSEPSFDPFENKIEAVNSSALPQQEKEEIVRFLNERYRHEMFVYNERTPNYIKQVESLGRQVKVYKHHEAHAATAFFGSGWDDCLVVTADGWGEDGSHTFYDCNIGSDGLLKFELCGRSDTIDSLGYFYGSVTKALGFVPHRHEGKVLGLAAHCPNPKSEKYISQMVTIDKERGGFIGRADLGYYLPHFDNLKLLKLSRRFSKEDLASAAQNTLEKVVCELIESKMQKPRKVALAGGIFANVKLNQRIAAIEDVLSCYVFPNMGDGGLSVGAGWLAHWEATHKKPIAPANMFLGTDVNDAEIERILSKVGVDFRRCLNIEFEISQLLAKGDVVARCAGPMEFGPRALGNRSILAPASDPSINDWLNKKLGRSEFMPFAPVVRVENCDDYFIDFDVSKPCLDFMTATVHCTDKMKVDGAAAVHVDGTARPQIVNESNHPSMHKILSYYFESTGYGCLINTSFNMHEEPIVCSTDDAVRAYLAGELPHLAIGNYLVSK
ncbi:hypothetical protein OA007_00810 [SAR116 cluster bacterium]|nr:hypothetical protein [SAR116 cluster bacterium]